MGLFRRVTGVTGALGAQGVLATWLACVAGLVLGLVVAVGPVQAQPHYGLTNLTQFCNGEETARRVVSVRGALRNVTLYWGGQTSHAAAAVLLVALRKLGYARVALSPGTSNLCDLKPAREELAVVPAATLGAHCDLDRIMIVRDAAAPLFLRLHLVLSRTARADPGCELATAVARGFYANASSLRRCGFLAPGEEQTARTRIYSPEVEPHTREAAVRRLGRLAWPGPRPQILSVNRTQLARLLHDGTSSFLFLDYELWESTPGVQLLPEPYRKSDEPYAPELEVFAINDALMNFAPPIYDVILNFSMKPKDLRELLEVVDRTNNWEQAACEWVATNNETLDSWLQKKRHDYWMAVVVCKDDPDQMWYRQDTKEAGNIIWNITRSLGYGMLINKIPIDCNNQYAMDKELSAISLSSNWYRCVGVVVPGDGVEHAAETAKYMQLPLVLYDAPADAAPGAGAAAGVSAQLALAIQEFLAGREWRRLAILSEPSATAIALASELRASDLLAIHEELLPHGANSSVTTRALHALKTVNAHVVLINGGWRMARVVLTEAKWLNMTDGYVWLARDWRGSPPPSPMRVFTVSFQCDKRTSVKDAELSLGLGFVELMLRAPEFRDDFHGEQAYREFWRNFDAINLTSPCQKTMRYEGGALVAPLVFLAEWNQSTSRKLGTWRVHDGRAEPLSDMVDPYAGGTAPSDGSLRCNWSHGEKFTPKCRDTEVFCWITGLSLVLVLGSVAGWVLRRRARRRRALRLLSEERRTRLWRERIVATLANKLVDREVVELREEIGSGRFGRVRLAVMRAPGRRPRTVAAKALHEDAAPAEEGEFLREACTLAALDHEHVVRLVGICATGGPPLVLMEHALFGDLLQYLRTRRHLAESASDPTTAEGTEAESVSAGELTRLAREAAAAVSYLAHRALVHRDVRAANCLVDARRTLKLGDFGMARETGPAGVDGDAEYASRRRGLFPVLWMAPESLSRGAFSAASDVWALGVLVFEVMTLGERPYGAWPPPRVVHHVLSGGRPRLPADATAQARGVALACWKQVACERPTAADLVAYLADRPRALAPALAPHDELGSVDSGFCEQAATKRPDTCHRIDRIDRIDDCHQPDYYDQCDE